LTPKYARKGDQLGRFIEECGEALAAAGKCVRFGYDSYNPELPTDKQERNIEWLLREISDVKQAIWSLEEVLLDREIRREDGDVGC